MSMYFLDYQKNWLADKSPIKIWEKSRRIGATYVQSYEDVEDIVSGKVPSVWFSSADESAAKEYILYCAQWAKMFDKSARDLGEVVLDGDKNVKAFQIVFSNGKRINALSSNPKAFRSKGGKVVLDEFAHHEDQTQLWKAAKPAATWGFPVRILSTHNGKQALFYKFIERIKKGQLKWSLHTTDIYKAVEDGLADKIHKRKLSKEERDSFIESCKQDSFDELTWLEEFCCIPVDESSSFIPYELYAKCEDGSIILPNYSDNDNLFLGVDVARKRDLTVFWLNRKINSMTITADVIIMKNAPFHEQKKVLYELLQRPNLRRCCIDATGLGMQLAEDAQRYFGSGKVEPIMFTQKSKEELAFNLKKEMESKSFLVPVDSDIKEDFHKIRKVTTISNNIRFDVDKSEEVAGHADRFWAAALSLYAGKSDFGIPFVGSTGSSYLDSFDNWNQFTKTIYDNY